MFSQVHLYTRLRWFLSVHAQVLLNKLVYRCIGESVRAIVRALRCLLAGSLANGHIASIQALNTQEFDHRPILAFPEPPDTYRSMEAVVKKKNSPRSIDQELEPLQQPAARLAARLLPAILQQRQPVPEAPQEAPEEPANSLGMATWSSGLNGRVVLPHRR